MPIKIKRKFEKEYGKLKGDKIFYAWENKNKYSIKSKRGKKWQKKLIRGLCIWAKLEKQIQKWKMFLNLLRLLKLVTRKNSQVRLGISQFEPPLP